MRDLEPLSDLARELLDEEEQAPLSRDAMRAQVRSRLEAALGSAFAPTPGEGLQAPDAPDAPPALPAPDPPSAGAPPTASPAAALPTKALSVGGAKLAVVIATSVVVGAVGGVSVDRSLRDARQPSAPSRTESSVVAPAAPPSAPSAVAPATSSAPVELPRAPSAAAAASVKPAPSGPSEPFGMDLARERSIIDAARAAARGGDGETALEAVSRHERAFPNGRLREEREFIRVLALATLGRREEAERAMSRFRKVYPESLFLPQLDAALKRTTP